MSVKILYLYAGNSVTSRFLSLPVPDGTPVQALPAYPFHRRYYPYFLQSGDIYLPAIPGYTSYLALLLVRSAETYAICYRLDLPRLMPTGWNGVFLLDNLSDGILNLICLSGASVTVLLKHWMQENQRMNDMEQRQVKTEVDQLKDQVSPPLLFHLLAYTSQLVKQDPEATSQVLFRLSELLHYQLYDANREKVVLTSEIRFLDNCLTLEQQASGKPAYTITSAGTTGRVFVSPLLLLSFVQAMVSPMKEFPGETSLYIYIDATPGNLLFTCAGNVPVAVPDQLWTRIRRRLELLYPGKYTLTVTPEAGQAGNTITLALQTQ